MPNLERYRVVVVGLGAQGTGVAQRLVDVGHDIVGVTDVGPKVGRPLTEFLTGERVPELRIRDDLDALLDELAPAPDIVVLTPALGLEAILELAGGVLDRGINAITLQQDVLTRDPAWADRMHDRAVRGGASFLASGFQDAWWVQLPALVASQSLDIEVVRLTSEVSLAGLSAGVGAEIGVPLSPEEFAEHAERTRDVPSVLGAPLGEAARRMGLTPGRATKTVAPILAEEPYAWELGGTTIPVGQTCGFREIVRFTTAEGIEFEGHHAVVTTPIEQTVERIDIVGSPNLTVEGHALPGFDITNTAIVARIPDVVEAAPGMLFAAELPPARHQLSRP